jgi:hypothetical protein
MNQRFSLPVLFLVFCSLASCGGRKGTPGENTDLQEKETNAIKQDENQISINQGNTDTTLSTLKPLIAKELSQWMQSFKNFQTDSFHQVDVRGFQEIDYKEVSVLNQFYTLYKPSLSFSPDSSQFIDLFSNGISLEKKGKKIIAIGDVDQAVTLCNLKAKNWKSIISFGPSASMEEALWVSPAKFILAGTMQNDEGKQQPVLLLGDTEKKSFRWFEANFIREESAKYKASGLSKLKIDEWE